MDTVPVPTLSRQGAWPTSVPAQREPATPARTHFVAAAGVDTIARAGEPIVLTAGTYTVRVCARGVVVTAWGISDTRSRGRGCRPGLVPDGPSEQVTAVLMAIAGSRRAPDPGPWPGHAHGLTQRQSEVVALIACGKSNREIVLALHLSMNTVKSYIRNAYRTMGVRTRSQAVIWALGHGFGGSGGA